MSTQAVRQYTGTGSPEGVIAAPPGSSYNQTNALTGNELWDKVSGTGSLGWRVRTNPQGSAGGSLAGTYPNPTLAAGVVGSNEINAAIKDAIAATASLRTLGTGSQQAAGGNDARLSDARTPTVHATSHNPGGTDVVQRFHQIPFSAKGTLAVTTGVLRVPMFITATIVGVWAMVNTAPTGANIIFDVRKNGTTIFTTQANRPTILASGTSSGLVSNMDITSLVAGDYITVDIAQVGSTVAGADAIIMFRYRY